MNMYFYIKYKATVYGISSYALILFSEYFKEFKLILKPMNLQNKFLSCHWGVKRNIYSCTYPE